MATTDKYDRQLRLWGAKGQKALSETTVLLVRATAAGTETLKNLVLPGVGTIVVVDDAYVTSNDTESNFFVTMSDKPRAQVALELLQELNPDVKGSYQHVPSLTKVNYTDLFASYSNFIVICADLEPTLLDLIAKDCPVPLIQVQSYGLLGLVRLQTREPLAIFDSKPASSTPDLRLVTPFPKFVEYCNSISMESLEDHEHSHVAYPAILYKLAQQWKSTHEGDLPSTFQEKQGFRNLVKASARKWDQEVNFHEAYNNAYLAYTEKTVDRSHVESLLHISKDAKTSALLSALLVFLDQHDGQAPLGGTLPDMTASTQSYVHLQQLYHDLAQVHVMELKSYLTTPVSDEELQTFCLNVFDLDIVSMRTLQQEYGETTPPKDVVEDLQSATWDPYEVQEHTPLLWYIGLRACRLFHLELGRYPGVNDAWESDTDLMQDKLRSVCSDLQLSDCDLIQNTLKTKNMATELARYANAEIHTIASVVGGVASQEAVKLITGQYTPLNNTYIYNGIASVGAVYQF